MAYKVTKQRGLLSYGTRSQAEKDVGIYNNAVEYAPSPHSISSIVMTLILVRDHTVSR
jgi:hypothetical protein